MLRKIKYNNYLPILVSIFSIIFATFSIRSLYDLSISLVSEVGKKELTLNPNLLYLTINKYLIMSLRNNC